MSKEEVLGIIKNTLVLKDLSTEQLSKLKKDD